MDGYAGGVGARDQTKREVTSYWYPTRLAQPTTLVPNSKLSAGPPHAIKKDEGRQITKEFDHVSILSSIRPKPIFRFIKTMLEDKDVLVRRSREDVEFFKNLSRRKAKRAARAMRT